MKMKKWIIALVALTAVNCFANRILWVGIGDNPQVEVNGVMTPLATWIASLPCDPADVGARIRVGDTAMPAGYQAFTDKGEEYIEFDNDTTEFEVALTSGGWADYQQIRLDNTDLNAMVFFELGYWDESANWEFVPMASANAPLSDLWNAHTYETFDMSEPVAGPWRPFATVPEPSTAILALLGTCLLLKRRKNTYA